jgi:hypothetical protein
MTSHIRVRIPSPTSLVSLRCLVVSVCVRRQTDDLTEHDSHDKKDNNNDDDDYMMMTMMIIIIIIHFNLLTCRLYSQVPIIKPAQRHKTQKLYKYTKIRHKKQTKIVR